MTPVQVPIEPLFPSETSGPGLQCLHFSQHSDWLIAMGVPPYALLRAFQGSGNLNFQMLPYSPYSPIYYVVRFITADNPTHNTNFLY